MGRAIAEPASCSTSGGAGDAAQPYGLAGRLLNHFWRVTSEDDLRSAEQPVPVPIPDEDEIRESWPASLEKECAWSLFPPTALHGLTIVPIIKLAAAVSALNTRLPFPR